MAREKGAGRERGDAGQTQPGWEPEVDLEWWAGSAGTGGSALESQSQSREGVE